MIVNLIEPMLGKTFVRVERRSGSQDELVFIMSDGGEFVFSHDQDCCEQVYIDDVSGDLADLVVLPLLQAEEAVARSGDAGGPEVDKWGDSSTWTFYKFATEKGRVNVKWIGSSNGYYSESVDLTLPDGRGWNPA